MKVTKRKASPFGTESSENVSDEKLLYPSGRLSAKNNDLYNGSSFVGAVESKELRDEIIRRYNLHDEFITLLKNIHANQKLSPFVMMTIETFINQEKK